MRAAWATRQARVQRNVYTQCCKCETVFRVSAEALRAADGQVRCGRCGEVFRALARLAEDAASFTRADEILAASIAQTQAANAATGEHATTADDQVAAGDLTQLQFLEPMDDELAAESCLEFSLPPEALDSVFIDTQSTLLPVRVAHQDAAPQAQEPPASAPHVQSPTPVPLTRIMGLEVAEDVRNELLASYNFADIADLNKPKRRLPAAAWLVSALLLGVLLVVQVVRANGAWLATHAPRLMAGYATLSSANLSSYQLRQWGVSGDPAAKGTLRVRASIMNTATQPQRYPLLRVSLVNRFGVSIGQRDFEPAEYFGKTSARMLAPGERADATLDILDPGKDAEGFEIDVCVRNSDKTIACAGDAAAQSG